MGNISFVTNRFTYMDLQVDIYLYTPFAHGAETKTVQHLTHVDVIFLLQFRGI